MPERALDVLGHDLDVGHRRQQLGVPVDEALVLVDQPGAIKLDEGLQHGLRRAGVHGEALPRPVAGGAEALELVDDGAAGFRLPGPDLFQERLAAEVAAARLAGGGEAPLDHHLGGDAGMVRARLPQHILAAHALEAAEDVLQGVVERVAHVERAGDVRRRNDDGERLGAEALGPVGAEGARGLPIGRDAGLDGGGVESLFHHGLGTGFARDFGATNPSAARKSMKMARFSEVREKRTELRRSWRNATAGRPLIRRASRATFSRKGRRSPPAQRLPFSPLGVRRTPV